MSFVSAEKRTDGSTIKVHGFTLLGSVSRKYGEKGTEHVFSPPMSSRSDFVITRKKITHHSIDKSKKPSLRPSPKSEESIDSGFARFNTIITSLKALDEGFSSKNYVRKFLRALQPKWSAKVTTIEELKDLSSLALEELIDNLKIHEVVMEKDSEIYKDKKERVKSIALKAKKESSDDETMTSGSDDEKYAMAVRNFKKFFKRKGKFVRQSREEISHFEKRMRRKERVTITALDDVIQIISLEIVQNHLVTKIKRPSLEVLEAIAKMTPKTKLTMKLVSWLNRQMRTKPISFVGSSAKNATDGSTIKVHGSTLPGSVSRTAAENVTEYVFSPPMSSRSDFVITRKKLIHNRIDDSKKPSLKPSLKSGLGYVKTMSSNFFGPKHDLIKNNITITKTTQTQLQRSSNKLHIDDIHPDLRGWELFFRKKFVCSLGKRNRVNACTTYMLYYLTIRRKFNFTSMILYRMEEVKNKRDDSMPFAMLLNCLYNHILQTNPQAIVLLARFTFHECVMDPLDILRNPSKEKGKRVSFPSVTPSSSSLSDDNEGPSFLEFYDELFDNEDLTKAQLKKRGMFKCLNHYVVTITNYLKKHN
nr:UBN2 domain-containing protein [Tanacetum cinerariifolium]